MDDDCDDPPEISLQYQRAFGAGIKRKRIDFIPQSAPTSNLTSAASRRPTRDIYLSIVMPKTIAQDVERESGLPQEDMPIAYSSTSEATEPTTSPPAQQTTCTVCQLPIISQEGSTQIPHEASMAHQVCVQHSHPPSHLDRNRKGLTYLGSYGWDPDARLGLGASGEGRLYPVRALAKEDKRGVGATKEKRSEVKKVKKLDAGEMRKRAAEGKRKDQRMRDLVYGNEEVNRQLGLEL